jgi:hypothetical protein
MAVQVFEVGLETSRVVVIDDFLADPGAVVRQAAALAPFPDIKENYYPGLRRVVTPADGAVFGYFDAMCGAVAPILRQLFGVERFRVTEAGFSLVTRPPHDTLPAQRVPHYDSLDPNDFAVLHYLNPGAMGGTAFYRHRRSGFEVLSEARAASYQAAVERDLMQFGPPQPGYFNETNAVWEKIGEVPWRYNRLLIYRGALFHSGIIPDGFAFSPDPLRGRLTGNLFLKATRPATTPPLEMTAPPR